MIFLNRRRKFYSKSRCFYQGVLIPVANVKHLMLRPEVVAAVRAGEFNVYAVDHVDQCLELLTGLALTQPQAVERIMDRFLPEGRLSVQKLPEPTPQSIVKAICSETAGALVIAATDTVLEGDLLQPLREQLRCSVFLVRRSGSYGD